MFQVGVNGRVKAHYNAFIEGVDEAFDSSRRRGSPLSITVGKGHVIPGFDIALSTMKKNELSRFLVEPEYAYGNLGCPPRIPAKACILYEVEMLSFKQSSALGEYEDLDDGDRERVTCEQVG